MRRMLDELKKMDYEYEVPANFSKKVMKEIKNIEAQKKKNMKKYVITWASTAAVILLAVTVTLKTNTKSGNLAFEKDSWQSMQMYSSSNVVDEKTENNAVPYYCSVSYLCSSFCTGTYGKTGISVRNSGAVFVIYDTLSDRGMGHHLPGCAQYQSWSGI